MWNGTSKRRARPAPCRSRTAAGASPPSHPSAEPPLGILERMTLRTDPLRVALAQLNATVGDIEGNARKIREAIARARDEGAQLVILPELALSGYPPEDLLLKTSFADAAAAALRELAADVRDIVALVGFPERRDDVYNAAAVLADGEIAATYPKGFLPNYGVFDEQRYFQAGTDAAIFELNGV